MDKQYEIKFSKARQVRGLKAWAVFEMVDESFSRGVSDHATEQEAKDALAALRAKQS